MVVANRVIGRSDRFQRRLSSQEGRAMASRVNREVYARFCGRLEVKFLRPTRRTLALSVPSHRFSVTAGLGVAAFDISEIDITILAGNVIGNLGNGTLIRNILLAYHWTY